MAECPICCSRKTHNHHDWEHLEPDEFWCDYCGYSWQQQMPDDSYLDPKLLWWYRRSVSIATPKAILLFPRMAWAIIKGAFNDTLLEHKPKEEK